MWINGPYPCGTHPDIKIFRDSLLSHLSENERVEADDGYIGECPLHIKCPGNITSRKETEYMQQRIRNRQESVNNRLKFWSILQNKPYRHDISKHGDVVRAVAVICQIGINNGEKLFECGYRDPPYE